MTIIKIIGLSFLIVFYGGYFLKMFIQRRNGIKTDSVAKGKKDKGTIIFEICLIIITYLVAFFQVVSIKSTRVVYLTSGSEYIGLPIALLGIILFLIAMITMRDSWRVGIDTTEKINIVRRGIYKYSRNPAFLGFDLFYIGIALAFPNTILICVSCLAVMMLHFQILQEEKYLSAMVGDEYRSYKMKVPRYILFL